MAEEGKPMHSRHAMHAGYEKLEANLKTESGAGEKPKEAAKGTGLNKDLCVRRERLENTRLCSGWTPKAK